jgi:hypothetical protein
LAAGALCRPALSFEAGDGRGIEREGNDDCGAREGELVDVRRRCRKRQHDNQLGRTRGEQEVESPA